MSFTTPTIDVYVPGTTLSIGNVNAGTINIGKSTSINSIRGDTTFNNKVILASGSTIRCGTVAADSSVYNTVVATTTVTAQTVTQTLIGQTYLFYRSSNGSAIANITATDLLVASITNTGIYIVCYQARFSAGSSFTTSYGVATWINISSPSYGKLAQNKSSYGNSPYYAFANGTDCWTGSWTGLINAGASVKIQAYLNYQNNADAFLVAGTEYNYLSITRIA